MALSVVVAVVVVVASTSLLRFSLFPFRSNSSLFGFYLLTIPVIH